MNSTCRNFRWYFRGVFTITLTMPLLLQAQYNQARKKTFYTLPGLLKVEAAALSRSANEALPIIKAGDDARQFLTRIDKSRQNTPLPLAFRRQQNISSKSIEKGIMSQRRIKKPLDLSFLATLGYSLLNRGNLYLQRNDLNTPTIIK